MWEMSFAMSSDWEVGEVAAVMTALGASLISVSTGPTPDTVIVGLRVPEPATLIGILHELNEKGWKV